MPQPPPSLHPRQLHCCGPRLQCAIKGCALGKKHRAGPSCCYLITAPCPTHPSPCLAMVCKHFFPSVPASSWHFFPWCACYFLASCPLTLARRSVLARQLSPCLNQGFTRARCLVHCSSDAPPRTRTRSQFHFQWAHAPLGTAEQWWVASRFCCERRQLMPHTCERTARMFFGSASQAAMRWAPGPPTFGARFFLSKECRRFADLGSEGGPVHNLTLQQCQPFFLSFLVASAPALLSQCVRARYSSCWTSGVLAASPPCSD